MNKYLLFIISCLISSFLFAQGPPKTIQVDGLLLDSITNKPLSFVTISLADAATKAPVKSTLTKDDGTFTINGLPPKPYLVSFVYVGYKSQTLSIPGSADFHSGTVKLSASNSRLKEVSVTALKPLMTQEVDRISYDVQADPEAKTVTALDMLRKVPLLSVDAEDNIKLRGSSSYKILLNGKESALMARSPADILKAMPGINIVKIEVITTPPAKYDAEGLAGIINIITQKNAAQGYNGSVNTNYNSVNGYRLNLNTTVKQGKFGVNVFAGAGIKPVLGAGFKNESDFFTVPSSLLQTGSKLNGNKNNYASGEVSYELDTLNLITANINANTSNNTQGTDQLTTQYNGSNVLTQAYHLVNNGTADGRGTDAGINYQLGFKHNKNQLLTISYKYSVFSNQQDNDVTTDEHTAYTLPNYRQYNKSGSKENTAQVDYIQPMKILTIEAGGKMILRNNYSNFNTDTVTKTGSYNTNTLLTNNFTYRQDVYSLYNSYTAKLIKWVFKGGLRFERTDINANLATTGGSFSPQYNNLVPSVSIQRSVSGNTLTFGFSQRIQRPGIFQLNPFPDNSNPQNITIGNPQLRPAVNNNFELSYGNFHKGSLRISSSYSFANNTIQNVTSVSGAGVTTTTFANVGKTRQLGLDVNANYNLAKRLNVNINAELLQVWLAGTFNGIYYTNSGQQGHVFTYTSYKFDDGYRLGLNLGFDSRYVLLQGVDNYYFNAGGIVSKDIFNKKATIGLMLSNPFSKFNKLDFFTKTADFQTTTSNLNYYRSVGFSFNYKFGRLNSEIKKNQRGINNDDTGGGRGN
jgi:outer membrane receptor protein involved in Fe transport